MGKIRKLGHRCKTHRKGGLKVKQIPTEPTRGFLDPNKDQNNTTSGNSRG